MNDRAAKAGGDNGGGGRLLGELADEAGELGRAVRMLDPSLADRLDTFGRRLAVAAVAPPPAEPDPPAPREATWEAVMQALAAPWRRVLIELIAPPPPWKPPPADLHGDRSFLLFFIGEILARGGSEREKASAVSAKLCRAKLHPAPKGDLVSTKLRRAELYRTPKGDLIDAAFLDAALQAALRLMPEHANLSPAGVRAMMRWRG